MMRGETNKRRNGTWIPLGTGKDIAYTKDHLSYSDKIDLKSGIDHGFVGLPLSEEQDKNENFKKGHDIGERRRMAQEDLDLLEAGKNWFLEGNQLDDSNFCDNDFFKIGFLVAKTNIRTEEINSRKGR